MATNTTTTTGKQPRGQGGRFASKPKLTTPTIYTDATVAAIELSQNPKALELSQEVSRLRTELATKQSECNVLQNTLDELRKIDQEREKQLKSLASDLRQSRIACEHNTAEVSRFRESLRLAEQGRDEAVRGRAAGLERIRLTQDENNGLRRLSEGYKATLDTTKSELATVRQELDNIAHTRNRELAQWGEDVQSAKDNIQRLTDQHKHIVFEGTLQTIAAAVICALAAFLVGRWAR